MSWSQFSPYTADWWRWTASCVHPAGRIWEARPVIDDDFMPEIKTVEQMSLSFSNRSAAGDMWKWTHIGYTANQLEYSWLKIVCLSFILYYVLTTLLLLLLGFWCFDCHGTLAGKL